MDEGGRHAIGSGRHAYQKQKAIERVGRKQEQLEVALALVVNRDPCYACGIRADRHDELGCGQYRPGL